jgi:L-serine deaminase
MAVSVFDLFKIGIGPSSSHTVGPMKAARLFALRLKDDGLLPKVAAVRTELFGSLGATGKGHGTDKAVILGLMGETPEEVDTTTVQPRIDAIRSAQQLDLLGCHPVSFVEKQHILFRRSALPYHPNGMTFAALNADGAFLDAATYYSVGGGFVVDSTATGAAEIYQKLVSRPEANLQDPLTVMDWVNVYAIAVNEENAWGGRVVTAPTNGAAGIIPAVLHYYTRFVPGATDDGVVRFLLTAGAIGTLYKKNASISGADVGCQGEVGVACSMAAAGLAEVRGGTCDQVENAAEIGMEHNLGLTCDPVGGLVQIPCIERNAMGAVKAINAARIALRGDGTHYVSLDKVIKTMRDTGADMKTKYKETARGGLAVNVIEC